MKRRLQLHQGDVATTVSLWDKLTPMQRTERVKDMFNDMQEILKGVVADEHKSLETKAGD
jgi:hypothetical protein